MTDVQQLACYLRGFGLLKPLSCRLTGVGNFKDELELAAHLLSEHHRPRRAHLQTAAELLSEVRLGAVPLSDWLPANISKYRNLLQWCDHRFQDMPMADR